MAVTSLLALVEQLLSDGAAAADFRAAPDQFLSDHGLGELSGVDVMDALSLGFGSVAPDLAVRLVLPEGESGHATAADALTDLLDAAPAESVLESEGADLGLDFGLGDLADGPTFGSGDPDARAGDDLDLDFGLDSDTASIDDLDTATFDHGFGSGSVDLDVTPLDDVDGLGDVGDTPDDLL